MSRIQIPIDVLTSRLNMGERFQNFRSGSIANRFSNLRPLSEFFDIKRLSKPENFAEMQSRVNYNLGHFSSNYAVVFVMLCIYALLTNPWLLFDIVFVVAGMWFIGKLDGRDLEIGQHRFTTSQLYTGLPSRRERARNGSDDEGWWGSGRVVEELDSEDGGPHTTQGVGSGLVSKTLGNRFASDPLRFTGVDMGNKGSGSARLRGRHSYGADTTDDDSEDSASDEEDNVHLESALARIRRAQAKGKADVKLTKDELAALERYQRRRNGEERRKKEKRIAVPLGALGQIEVPRGNSRGEPSRTPREQSPVPPSRLPSGSTTAEREQSSSPFHYSYVKDQPGPIRRSRDSPPHGDISPGASGSSHHDISRQASTGSGVDPFQYLHPGGSTRPTYTGDNRSRTTTSDRHRTTSDLSPGDYSAGEEDRHRHSSRISSSAGRSTSHYDRSERARVAEEQSLHDISSSSRRTSGDPPSIVKRKEMLTGSSSKSSSSSKRRSRG
ncbi:PRA1 family domain-containing protein [Neurospora intermedia]|uniref:PRA1 family domain-containing protein n=1 Tax=Neurospora intermedia TaxID=5142 RepID=A0ABR3DAY0_NEUIN